MFFYDPKTIGTIDCGDSFGETGAFWYFKYKNCVLDNFMAQGIVKTVFCKFKEDHTVERGHTYYFGYDTVKGEEFKTFIDDERVTESEFEKFYEKELEPFKEEESYIASTFGSLGNYETAFSRDTEDILYQLYICLLNQAEPDPKNRYFDYEQNR